MTSTDSDQLSDEALASSISDDGRLSSDGFDSDEEGIVEVGIPPQAGSIEDVELEEEPFILDDFDSVKSVDADPDSVAAASPANDNSSIDVKDAHSSNSDKPSDFGQTLHNQVNISAGSIIDSEATSSPPNENPVIDGQDKTNSPTFRSTDSDQPPHTQANGQVAEFRKTLWDQDLYSKRPLARLQGWISGLSFGVGRRAKKFSR
jgi:hypothetical protein